MPVSPWSRAWIIGAAYNKEARNGEHHDFLANFLANYLEASDQEDITGHPENDDEHDSGRGRRAYASRQGGMPRVSSAAISGRCSITPS
jgi:hypothetical protein